jgi:hypothetical protein
MKSFVYITTNLINGKKYLGKHNGKHDDYLGSGTVLKDAIKKYGKENFEREIVKECLTDEAAYELEKQLSETWNVVSDPNWYNMRIGGEGFQSGELHPMFGIPNKRVWNSIHYDEFCAPSNCESVTLERRPVQ